MQDKKPVGKRVDTVRGHSALPWTHSFEWSDNGSKYLCISDASHGDVVGESPTSEGDARFIVTACNHHDELVDMVRDLVEELDYREDGTQVADDAQDLLTRIEREGETS